MYVPIVYGFLPEINVFVFVYRKIVMLKNTDVMTLNDPIYRSAMSTFKMNAIK